ncbi:uncharacterized protein LOC123674269 isoform X3 [Harmonia axyridis]|uniref:uncharacterized protein LOC123674269 isoform X3 n=1 Tax=Harmonia axyridis TaxID=115357 RepID=UPI001E2792B4|nr:uncharacterized protein LOC123674269 isoform X3 [Harmonia axyridis]
MSSVVRFGDTQTVQFLEYYRNEKVLWDPSHEDYKKRDKRAAAAQRIAKKLNVPNFTGSHVCTKFKNLRSSYSQELKKIASSERSGVSSDDIYTPKVFWFKVMNGFLRPHVRTRETMSNLESTENSEYSEDLSQINYEYSEDLSIIKSEYSDQSVVGDEEEVIYEDQRSSETTQWGEFASKEGYNSPNPSKRAKRTSSINTDGTNTSSLNEAPNRLRSIPSNRSDIYDEYSLFGEQVGMKIRKLSSARARMMAQNMINNILYEAEIGMYDNDQQKQNSALYSRPVP